MVNIGKLALGILREKYAAGTRVELVYMSDPYNTALVPGARGTVVSVDDIGTIHVRWDCGSSLGIVYGEDVCSKLDSVTITCYGKTTVWDDRMEALRFYKQGAEECDGAESARYARIVFQLLDGMSVCTDKEEE